MATYYVNASTGIDTGSQDGSSGEPWATWNYADSRISSGDMVRVAPGTYYEAVEITKANTTWVHDESSSAPIYIDGRYDPVEVFAANINKILRPDTPGNNWVISGYNAVKAGRALLKVDANNVTVDGKFEWGITIRNSASRGLSLHPGNSGAIVRFVRSDFCYEGGFRDFAEDSLIEDCCITRSGMMYFDPDRVDYLGGGPQKVPSAMLFNDADGATIRRTLVQANYGEGIACGKRSRNITVEDCESSTNLHVHIYMSSSNNAVIRRNMVWIDTSTADFMGGGTTAEGIVMGDETGAPNAPGLAYASRNPKIYNNVVLGTKTCFSLRWNAPPHENYRTIVEGLYVGFNTFIANDPVSTWGAVVAVRGGDGGRVMMFENNIIEIVPGLGITPVTWGSTLAGNTVAIRNNIWRSQPTANARGTNDQYGNPNLKNSSYQPPVLNYTRNMVNFVPVSIRDTADFFHLKPNSALAIDNASNGSDLNTNTPPTITTDFDGATRDADRDIGAWEFDGTPTDPEETLTANFTQSATAGFAPLTVNFTDTSVSSGTITSRAWDFGDGTTSTDTNPTKIYNTPGVYTPRLTVNDSNGLQKQKTGSDITVTTPGDDSGGATASFSAVRTTVATSTGLMAPIDLAELGERPPVAMLFSLSNATTVGTPANDALLSIGFWAGGQGYSQTIFTKDAQTSGTSVRLARDTTVALSMSDTAITGELEVASVANGSVTLNVTDAFPAAYQLTIVAFAGAAAEAEVAKKRAGAVGSSFTGPGGDIALAFSAWANTVGSVTNDAEIAFGAAAGTAKAASLWHDKNGADPTQAHYSVTSSFILRDRTAASTRANIRPDNVSSGTYTITNDSSNHDLILAALRLDGEVQVGQIAAGTTTGNVSYDFGFEPTLVLLWGGLLDVNDAQGLSNAKGSAFWIAAVTEAGTFYVGVTSEDAAATSNTQSNVEDSIKVIRGGNTVTLAGTAALDADGIDIDWTTASGNAVIVNYAAFEGGEPIVENQAIPGFSASPLSVEVGDVVTFQNLTNANGATISGYSWDFGDLTPVSTDTNPTHIYDEEGTYTVTLTVTTGAGPISLPKAGYITVVYVPDTVVIRRASLPATITNTTETILHDDLNDDENFGYHEHATNFDGLQVELDPADREVPAGYFWIYAVSEDNGDVTLLAKDGDGSTYTGPTFTKD